MFNNVNFKQLIEKRNLNICLYVCTEKPHRI